ncbi:MAG: hypothetical protein HY696_11055 [Deltaproteobacteria bacterium]|nr:hypothetical protein [Deltaproteobacteria bacterium]
MRFLRWHWFAEYPQCAWVRGALCGLLFLAGPVGAAEEEARAEPDPPPAAESSAEEQEAPPRGETTHELATQQAALTEDGAAAAPGAAVGAPMDDTQSPLGDHGLAVQEAGVGPAGGVSLPFPLQLLPGRHGMTPVVAAVYSSGNRSNGPLGYGMELVAGGQITRRGWREGVVPPQSYGPGFFSNFDWANERYRVNVEGNAQEIFYAGSATAGGLRFLPRYQSHWVVTAPNQFLFDKWGARLPTGMRYQFTSHPGTTSAIKRNEQYLVAAISPDEQTNTFYRYRAGAPFMIGGVDVGSRAVVLAEIRYSCALEESDTCYKVLFHYEYRDDVVISAQSGQVVGSAERVKRVDVLTPTGELAWSYHFTYVQDHINGHSLLREIQQTFKGGQSLLPPIRLTFSEAQPPPEYWPLNTTPLGALSYSYQSFYAQETLGTPQYNKDEDGKPINPMEGDPIIYVGGTQWVEAEEFVFGAGVFFADPNHDGLPDLIQRDIAKQDWINQGDGTFAPTPAAFAGSVGADGYWMRRHTTEATTIPGFKKDAAAAAQPKAATLLKEVLDANVQMGDVDGDGQSDLLVNGVGMAVTPAGILGSGVFDLRGQPLSVAPTLPVALAGAGPTYNSPGVVTVDLNGDGYVDLLQGVMESYPPGTQHRAWLYDPVTKHFQERAQWAPPVVFSRFGVDLGVQFTDFNADGLVDLYSMNQKYVENNGLFLNTGNGWLNVTADWVAAWNGGEQAPTVVVTASGETKFPASIDFPDNQNRSVDSGWRWFDLNADGIDDMIYAVVSIGSDGKSTTEYHTLLGSAVRQWRAYMGKNIMGDAVSPKFVVPMATRFRSQNPDDDKTYTIDRGVRVLDLNGDRVPDLVENVCAIGQASCVATVHLNSLALPNLLKTVRAPMGTTTTFAYTTYAKFEEAVGSPPLVVQSVKVADVAGAAIGARTFEFADPQFVAKPESSESADSEYDERRGPELLGFREVRMIETGLHPAYGAMSERRTTTIYKPGYAFMGMVEQQQMHVREDLKQKSSSAEWPPQPVSAVSQTYHEVGTAKPPYAPRVHITETTQNEGGLKRTVRTEYQEYDPYGFPIAIHHHGRIDAAVGLTDDVQESRIYTRREDPYILGLLEKSTTTANGLKRSVDNVYDDLGRLQKTTTEADGAASSWTSYSYDSYSNRDIERRSGADPDAPSSQTRIFYDANYAQFVIGQENTLAQRSMVTYAGVNAAEPLTSGASFGKPVRVEGLSTTAVAAAHYDLHTYDMFGRLEQRMSMGRALEQGKWIDALDRAQTWKHFIFAADGQSQTTRTDHPSFYSAKGTPSSMTEMTLNDRGKIVRVRTLGQQGWRQVLTEYGPYATVWRVSEPHRDGEPVRWTTTTVDALGRKIVVENPTSVESYEYRPFQVHTVYADGQKSTVESDGRDRVILRSHPGGGQTAISYGVADGRITMTGPDGKNTILQRNGLELVTQRVDPDRGTWTWQYNARGMQAAQIDAKQIATRFHYDLLDRVRAVDVGDDGNFEAEYFYDGNTPTTQSLEATALGQRSAMRDAQGITRWHYNAQGLVQQLEKTVDGVTHRALYTYDHRGRVSEFRDVDPAAQPKIGLTAGAMPTADPIRFTIRYQYDLDGLTKVQSRVGQQPWQVSIAAITYDGSGRLQQVTYGNGTQEDFTYLPNTGQLQQRRVTRPGSGNATALLDFTYAYEHPLGFISAITDAVTPSSSQQFTYHADRSLASAKSQVYGEVAYYADAAGNLINHGPWTLAYADKRPHAVSSAYHQQTKQQISYAYDANGNITGSWDRIFTYDDQNRLSRLQSSLGFVDFVYDGDGRRVKQLTTVLQGQRAAPTLKTADGRTLRQMWQAAFGIPSAVAAVAPSRSTGALVRSQAGKMPAVTNPLGAVPGTNKPPAARAQQPVPTPRAKQPIAIPRTRTPTLAALQPSAQTMTTPFDELEIVERDGNVERRYHIMALDRRVATVTVVEATPVIRYFYADHLGSRSIVADATGTVTDGRTLYTPYGTPLAADGQPQWHGWQDQTNMYTGVELPEVVDLYLTGPRTYDPVIGRFLQPDAIPGDPTASVAANPYAYAMNNPIVALDPSGFSSESAQMNGGGWFGFLWNLVEGFVEMAVSGGKDFSFGLSLGANTSGSSGAFGPSLGDGAYGRGPFSVSEETLARDPAGIQQEAARMLTEYGIDAEDGPELIFVKELYLRGEPVKGAFEPPDNSTCSPATPCRGKIYLASWTLSTLYHEMGHYLHIGARVFDTANRYLGSLEQKEALGDIFMMRELNRQGHTGVELGINESARAALRRWERISFVSGGNMWSGQDLNQHFFNVEKVGNW